MGPAGRLRVVLGWLFFVSLVVSCGQVPHLVVLVQDRLTAEPLAGAECRLEEVRSVSDPAGRCSFVQWSVGDRLEVVAQGYQREEAALPGLEVTGDPPVSTVTVSLWPDRFVGTLVDAYTGGPVAAAEVRGAGAAVLSDDQGQFVLMNPTFPLSLTVEAAAYEPWLGSFQAAVAQVALRPNTLEGRVHDRFTQEPLAGVTVTVAGSSALTATTDADGYYRLEGVPEAFRLEARAALYRPESVFLERTTRHDLFLRPAFLRGLVRDLESGRPISLTRVVWSAGYVHTDAHGKFFLADVPEEVVLQVLAPGFAKQVITVTESSSVTVELTPFAVQGIYVTAYVAGTSDWFASLLDFVDRTELNALVIEVKDAWGVVTYDSQIPLVQELRENGLNHSAWSSRSEVRFDVRDLLRRCHERGIYTIAYIVVFEDSWLTLDGAYPEWAIQSAARGAPWTDRKGLRWTDPYRPEVWEYNISVAQELAGLGFDEIQFDYIRFPTDGDTTDVVYVEETDVEKQYEAIAGFARQAYEELAPMGVFVSADVFGYAAWRKMWEQGQDISLMTHYLDYLCPMAYPSHYSPGEQGCANPNACPYPIVLETLKRAHGQMTGGQRAVVRPWLQDFDLGSPPYGATEVEDQIRAARDGGAIGFCLWNAGNVYTDGVDYSP